jgi:hypothetical protein
MKQKTTSMETEAQKRIKEQILMEKNHEASSRLEIQKLYYKKINYGHKIMELYKPESHPSTSKMEN